MAARKNIFLIGRRGHEHDEDQLTEMLAFLWQEDRDALARWLSSLGLAPDVSDAEVETQVTIPSGKRPDIVIRSNDAVTVVESKLRSGFGETQIPDYLEFLSEEKGMRSLVLLTQKPEVVPANYRREATDLGVELVTTRWHDMAKHLGEFGDETLAGDFIQLLSREELVKPKAFRATDWHAWHAGYEVSLRIDALLTELDRPIANILPRAKGRSGSSKLWTWRAWSTGTIDVGLAFLAAEWTTRPRTPPCIHCWVLNRESDDRAKMAAVDVTANRSSWTQSDELRGSYGLNPFGPAISRDAKELFGAGTLEEQLNEAASFIKETVAYFTSRHYLPELRASCSSHSGAA